MDSNKEHPWNIPKQLQWWFLAVGALLGAVFGVLLGGVLNSPVTWVWVAIGIVVGVVAGALAGIGTGKAVVVAGTGEQNDRERLDLIMKLISTGATIALALVGLQINNTIRDNEAKRAQADDI